MNDFTILSNQVETCIQELIDQTFQNEDLRNIFPNRLLREDVLDLLDRYCTVVYYPLEEEERNNGFCIFGREATTLSHILIDIPNVAKLVGSRERLFL